MTKAAVGRTKNESKLVQPQAPRARRAATNAPQDSLHEVLTLAEERGLLAGSRTHVLRGRMPVGLVEQAKLKTGISSDSKLLEVALANLTVSDDYGQWLLSQRGTVNPELDLEF